MKVLVIVDMQKDFIDGSLANSKSHDVLGRILKEINKDYGLFLLTRDTHFDTYLNTYEGKNLPIKHCIKGSDGWNIHKDILNALDRKEYKIVDKNGFGSYELINELEKYNNDIEDITIVGLVSDICVVSNALLLRSKFIDTPIYYIEEATYGTSKENHDAAIKVLNSCQIYEKKEN